MSLLQLPVPDSAIIARRGVTPRVGERLGRTIESVGEDDRAARPMLLDPLTDLGLALSDRGLGLRELGLPLLKFTGKAGVNETVVRLDPLLGREGRDEDGLKTVVVSLSERLELVIVTLRALNRQAEQSRRDVLHRRLDHGVTVDSYLIGVPVTFAAAVLTVAQVVCRLNEFDGG